MERQRHVCVIDWFGVNYDGTMPTILLACDENWLPSLPTILLACDENWFALFPVAPPIPRPSSLPIDRTGQIVSIDKIARRRILRKDAYD